MNTLHDDHDRARALVVKAGEQRIREPLIGCQPLCFGQGVVRLQRIVDDDDVAASTAVNVPPTEVASRNPRAVSSISVSEFLYGRASSNDPLCCQSYRRHHLSPKRVPAVQIVRSPCASTPPKKYTGLCASIAGSRACSKAKASWIAFLSPRAASLAS